MCICMQPKGCWGVHAMGAQMCAYACSQGCLGVQTCAYAAKGMQVCASKGVQVCAFALNQ